jgi:hypothetical protein
MTRTLRARNARPLPADNNVSDSGEDPYSKPLRNRVKRAKNEDKAALLDSSSTKTLAKSRIAKGRVGKLAQLQHIPLEVLFEVCCNVFDYHHLVCCIYSCSP